MNLRDKTRHVLLKKRQQEIYPTYHKGLLHKKQQQGSDLIKSLDLTTSLQEIQGLEDSVNTTVQLQPAKPKMWEIPEDT